MLLINLPSRYSLQFDLWLISWLIGWNFFPEYRPSSLVDLVKQTLSEEEWDKIGKTVTRDNEIFILNYLDCPTR